MKLAIIIFVISTLITFKKINYDLSDMFNSVYGFWIVVKAISVLTMIGSFIAIVVMWQKGKNKMKNEINDYYEPTIKTSRTTTRNTNYYQLNLFLL